MLAGAKVLITGGHGFLGRHLVPMIREQGAKGVSAPGKDFYDLTQPWQARHMLGDVDPNLVIHLAAHNGSPRFMEKRPGEIFYRNIVMGTEVVEACRLARKPRLVLVVPNCAGTYGFAHRAVQVLANSYREQYSLNVASCLLTEAYGPYEPDYGVVGAPLQAVLKAVATRDTVVQLPGTGHEPHELIYGADAAEAIMRVAVNHDKPDLLEITSGEVVTRREIAEHLADFIGFDGELVFEDAAPVPEVRPLMNPFPAIDRIGFTTTTPLRDGLKRTIAWYRTWFTT